MNMSVKEAVRIASRWVHVSVMGDGLYQVAYWDKSRRVWWEGNPKPREDALRNGWRIKIRTALQLLGIRDAEGVVHDLEDNYPKDWRHSVREGIRIAESRKLKA